MEQNTLTLNVLNVIFEQWNHKLILRISHIIVRCNVNNITEEQIILDKTENDLY